jgi:hypothetical protein
MLYICQEEYDLLMLQKYGGSIEQYPEGIDPEIWKEVAGLTKDGRLRGLGRLSSQASASSVAGPSTSTHTADAAPTTMSEMRELVAEVVDDRVRPLLLEVLSLIKDRSTPRDIPPSTDG